MLESSASLGDSRESSPATDRQIVRFGLFEADLERRKLSKDGLRVKVQEQPFVILALLLSGQERS